MRASMRSLSQRWGRKSEQELKDEAERRAISFRLHAAQHKFRVWMGEVVLGGVFAVVYFGLGVLIYKELEDWDALETLYFTSVTMTTIGYGDVSPDTPAGQWFTIFYALLGIALMYGALKKLFMWVLLQQETLTAAVIKRLKDKAGIFGLFYSFGIVMDRKIDEWLPGTGLVLKKVVLALVPMFLYILTGTIIGLVEGWNFGESFYWAAMTVTTIGYGDYKPESPGGRGFCIIYCPCAVLVLARTGLQVKNVLQEANLKKISLTKIKAMDRDGNGKITRAEYMAAVLLSMGQATEETIELIEFQFRYLDSKDRGFLDDEDIDRIHELNLKSINEIINLDMMMKAQDEAKLRAAEESEKKAENKKVTDLDAALESGAGEEVGTGLTGEVKKVVL